MLILGENPTALTNASEKDDGAGASGNGALTLFSQDWGGGPRRGVGRGSWGVDVETTDRPGVRFLEVAAGGEPITTAADPYAHGKEDQCIRGGGGRLPLSRRVYRLDSTFLPLLQD